MNMTQGSNTKHIPALDAIFGKCILTKLKFTVFPTEQMCISWNLFERSSYIVYVVDKPLFDSP